MCSDQVVFEAGKFLESCCNRKSAFKLFSPNKDFPGHFQRKLPREFKKCGVFFSEIFGYFCVFDGGGGGGGDLKRENVVTLI